MNFVSLGDMAQFFTLRQHNANLQMALSNRVSELASGEVADVTEHLRGNFTSLSGIERSLDMVESYRLVISQAKIFTKSQQDSFTQARSYAESTGMSLLRAADPDDEIHRDAVLSKARTDFDSIMSALNSTNGQTLFSGAATQSAAFEDPEQILTALSAALTTATDANDVMTLADAWFASGGAYEGAAYLGSTTPLSGFRVGEGVTVNPTLSGDDQEIRDLVKLHALTAVMAEGGITLIDAEIRNLMATIGGDLRNLDRDLIAKSAEIGALEARIDMIEAQNSAENYALMQSRKDLVGVDTAETALWLSETETQLEALYAVTARLSRLSLTEYL